MELKLNEKYMLTIKEAAAYYGIGMKFLRRCAENEEGKFPVICGNRVMIIKTRFEEYLHAKGGYAGLGIGVTYNVIIASVNAWFPDKRGFCSGCLLMGFGMTSLVFGSILDALFANEAIGWRKTFLACFLFNQAIGYAVGAQGETEGGVFDDDVFGGHDIYSFFICSNWVRSRDFQGNRVFSER